MAKKNIPKIGRRLFAALFPWLLLLAGGEALYRLFWFAKSRTGPSDVFEIYVLGESSAYGEPFAPKISFPKIAAEMFGGRIGGRRIRLVNLAQSGSTIYPQALRLQREIKYRNRRNPGALLVYSGHNESALWNPLQVSLLERAKNAIGGKSLLLEDFILFLERRRVVRLPRNLSTYDFNLRRVVRLGRENGLHVFLSTVIGNLADVEPSLKASEARDPAGLKRALREAAALESRGDFRKAAAFHRGRAEEFPEFAAYFVFRAGKCRQAAGDLEAARRLFWEAVDLRQNGGFGRATSGQNDLVRRLAAEEGAFLVDAAREFEREAPGGLVGRELMIDGHHPTLRGYILLARSYARSMSAALGVPLAKEGLTPEEVMIEFDFSSDDMQRALLASGRWLLFTSLEHEAPVRRLGMAEAHFREATRTGAEPFSGWMGLALVEAARRGLLADAEQRAWFEKERLLTYGSHFQIGEGRLQPVLERLESFGVGRETLALLRRHYARPGEGA